MKFECVPFHTIGHEIAKNMEKHYEEVQKKEGYGKVNADWKTYLELSASGQCLAFIGKDNDEIRAYSVFILTHNINHKTVMEASNCALYVWPEYRGKGTIHFLKWINKYLQDLGVNEIGYLMHDEKIGKLLHKIGMKPTHTLWTIRNE